MRKHLRNPEHSLVHNRNSVIVSKSCELSIQIEHSFLTYNPVFHIFIHFNYCDFPIRKKKMSIYRYIANMKTEYLATTTILVIQTQTLKLFFFVLGITEPRVLCLLSTWSITKLHPSLSLSFFFFFVLGIEPSGLTTEPHPSFFNTFT